VSDDVKAPSIDDAAERAQFKNLTDAKKRIDTGKAEASDWDTVHTLLGRSETERAWVGGDRGQQERMQQHLLSSEIEQIHAGERSRQRMKGGMAGVAAVGHVTSAVGSITGGADLGATKVAGTTTTAGVGTVRSMFDISERFNDYRRLGYAKNYADAQHGGDPEKQKKRGSLWAAGHMLGDVGNVMYSNMRTLGGYSGTKPSDWRAQHGHRTMEESAENLRQVVSGQKQGQSKYKTTAVTGGTADDNGVQQPVKGGQLSQTQGKMVVDLASRKNRLNAATLVDAAGGRGAGNAHTKQAAAKVLGALDVGIGEHETWGSNPDGTVDEDTRKANIEAFMQRHALRR